MMFAFHDVHGVWSANSHFASMMFTPKLEVWLKLERYDGKVESLKKNFETKHGDSISCSILRYGGRV